MEKNRNQKRAKHCCSSFRERVEKEDFIQENDGTWNIQGCCENGCWVIQHMEWCPWCGASLPGKTPTTQYGAPKEPELLPMRIQELTEKIDAIQIGWWYVTCCSIGLQQFVTAEEFNDFLLDAHSSAFQSFHAKQYGPWIIDAWETEEEAWTALIAHGYPQHLGTQHSFLRADRTQ